MKFVFLDTMDRLQCLRLGVDGDLRGVLHADAIGVCVCARARACMCVCVERLCRVPCVYVCVRARVCVYTDIILTHTTPHIKIYTYMYTRARARAQKYTHIPAGLPADPGPWPASPPC